MTLSYRDLAYANPTEKKLIALALREVADGIKTEVTVQSRSEEYGRNRAIEKVLERAREYDPGTQTVVTGD